MTKNIPDIALSNNDRRRIWKRPCKQCPSAHHPPDPESIDFKEMYDKGELTAFDVTFICAWRGKKVCRGVCDYMGVTEKDLQGPIVGVFQQ